MNILVTGASGLVGKALCQFLEKSGHQIVRLVRRQPRNGNEVRWSPEKGLIDTDALNQHTIDAVIHLAGESILGLGWTKSKKESIKNSRVNGTRALAEAITQLDNVPHTFISSSAIGYYGNRGEEVLTEMSDPGIAIHRQQRNKPFFFADPNWGSDFLSDTCVAWEKATEPAKEAGIRVVNMRTGFVIGKDGAAFKLMLPAFKAGVAGPLGSGEQYMSWISLDDLVSSISHVLNDSEIKGPVNAVSPNPSTNKEFTKELSKRAFILPFLGEAANFIPVPGFALKASPIGEMANALFLSSTKVKPVCLEETGYQFLHSTIASAFKAELA
jgi:hypothetical protein